jgi:hypothetical protein
MTQEDYKLRRRYQTREDAAVLLDDMEFMRESIQKDQIRSGEIRRMSAILRRFLVDGMIKKVSSPRTGKINIICPDESKFVISNKKQKFLFFGLGFIKIFGIYVACPTIENSNNPRNIDFNPEQSVSLTVDEFKKQNVIAFQGVWITRHDIIKFIANKAGGVHSDERREKPKEKIIQSVRTTVNVKLYNEAIILCSNISSFVSTQIPSIIDRSNVDWVLIELLSTASFLVNSPDIYELEKFIKREMGEEA